jgi:hypothetical protein
MSTAQATSNKATLRRLHDAMNNAMNTGDAELISKTIDEFVEPADRRLGRHHPGIGVTTPSTKGSPQGLGKVPDCPWKLRCCADPT